MESAGHWISTADVSNSGQAQEAAEEEGQLTCEAHDHGVSELKGETLPLSEAQDMAEFFGVLGDATRLRLISVLAAEECCVCDLATRLEMTESAISHQLRALRTARLVRYRKEGRQVFYRLHDFHVLSLYQTVREHLNE